MTIVYYIKVPDLLYFGASFAHAQLHYKNDQPMNITHCIHFTDVRVRLIEVSV